MKKILFFFFFIFFVFSIYSKDSEKIINFEKVKTIWLSWINEERKKNNLHPYKYHYKLNKTAKQWCLISLKREGISHKRDINDPSFYNYKEIKEWFFKQKIKFKNINGYTFTENIGWGYFNYKSGNYTEYVIKSIRKTFNYYMSEKGKTDYWENAHYRSITAPYFYYIGLGLIIDEKNKKYYLTVHYASEVIEVKDENK